MDEDRLFIAKKGEKEGKGDGEEERKQTKGKVGEHCPIDNDHGRRYKDMPNLALNAFGKREAKLKPD